MYFAKFFHKAPTDGRFLLYTPNILMGFYVREVDYLSYLDEGMKLDPTGNLPDEFLRREYGSLPEGVAAYRREIEGLRDGGYVETHHTDYTLRDLNGDATPKPDWQRSLDEMLLAMLVDPLSV